MTIAGDLGRKATKQTNKDLVPFFVRPGPEVIKLFMLNSAEHKIYPAHKC